MANEAYHRCDSGCIIVQRLTTKSFGLLTVAVLLLRDLPQGLLGATVAVALLRLPLQALSGEITGQLSCRWKHDERNAHTITVNGEAFP
jgi:hypothetical protein